ncbi:hypothetical protein [Streptomyces sp. MN13]
MPTWITPRRLGAAAVLYAVFVGGWYLGQPLPGVGCDVPEPGAVADGPVTVGEPGDVTDDLDRTFTTIATAEVFTIEAVHCDGESDPRLLAWLTGDWR